MYIHNPDKFINENSELMLPEGTTDVKWSALQVYPCKLVHINIPGSCKNIENRALLKQRGLKSVNIEFGVTSIGECAFLGCSKLKDISLPQTISEIGADAFNECTALRKIVLPNNLPEIQFNCFANCDHLTDITFPDRLERILNFAFAGCFSLESVFLPEMLCEIAQDAFTLCCNLRNIVVDERNSFFTSEDGVLYNKGKTTLLICPPGKEGVLHVSNTCSKICPGAFEYCKIEKIILPKSLNKLGEENFKSCKSLKEICVE